MIKKILILFFFYSFISKEKLPNGFVYLLDYSKTIQVDLKYYSKQNFTASFIRGYYANKAIVTEPTAKALVKVQKALEKKNLSLLIYDAYRPQKAVTHFLNWSKALKDTINKQIYYPKYKKKDLFNLGFIASKSRHSSGSTVDVTLIDLSTNKVLDMGGVFDYFGEKSSVNYRDITNIQKKNRQLLQKVMLSNGFRNYSKEWWHFTLRGEPFRNQYFNFNVE